MPEADGWSITTNSQQLFALKVPKPKSSRRTVVNRVINECESRRNRHGGIFNHNLGHEEDRNPRRLGRRDTRGSTGVPDHFSSL